MDIIDISNFSDICRVCLQRGTLHSIFNYSNNLNSDDVHDLSKKIVICADITVGSGDGLPSNICKQCVHNLMTAYQFKISSESSDRTLRNILKSQEKYISPKTSKSKITKRTCNLKPDITSVKRNRVICKTNEKHEKKTYLSKLKKKTLVTSKIVSDKNSDKKDECKDACITFKSRNNNPLPGDEKSLMDAFQDNISDSDTEENGKCSLNDSSLKTDEFDVRANFLDDYYGCLECKKQFPNKLVLHKHMSEEHGSHLKKTYKCYGCDIMFATKYRRSEHEQKNCPKMPPGSKYHCRDCKTIWETRKDFDVHIRRHRPNMATPKANTLELGPLFPCPHCPKTLATQGSLYTHVQNHSKEDFVCEICGKCFKTRIRLMCHIRLHQNHKAFSCKECDFKTSTRNSLLLHIRKHSGERPYSCEVCGKLTATKSNLNSHRKRHMGVKNFKCDICGKCYVDKPPLEEHIMAVHAGLRPHGCEHCGATYTRKTGLRRHIKKRHPKGS